MKQSTNKVSVGNKTMLISALFVALGLSACDRPTVVNVPATPVAVPGPAGATGAAGNEGTKGETGNQGNQGNEGTKGATGNQGNEGTKGETGKSGGTTVIVTPPAAPAN